MLRAFAEVYKERRGIEAAESVPSSDRSGLRDEVFRRMQDGEVNSSSTEYESSDHSLGPEADE